MVTDLLWDGAALVLARITWCWIISQSANGIGGLSWAAARFLAGINYGGSVSG